MPQTSKQNKKYQKATQEKTTEIHRRPASLPEPQQAADDIRRQLRPGQSTGREARVRVPQTPRPIGRPVLERRRTGLGRIAEEGSGLQDVQGA